MPEDHGVDHGFQQWRVELFPVRNDPLGTGVWDLKDGLQMDSFGFPVRLRTVASNLEGCISVMMYIIF